MKERLYVNNKIEVRLSLVHGYGIFAKEQIEKDEILEECLFILQHKNIHNIDYLYRFPKLGPIKHDVLVLGNGSIYNSSRTIEGRNATWDIDEHHNLFIFTSTRTIAKDEEIFTYYGDQWWQNRKHKNLPETI